MLVAVVSMNDLVEVEKVFEHRESEMVLKKEQVVSMMVNWEPKVNNISKLASDLTLGLDSFMFFDDDPINIVSVSAMIPQVLAIRWPEVC